MACESIFERNEINNLVLEISNPTEIDDEWCARYNPKNADNTVAHSASDVANTIFPERIYERATSRKELYARYALVYARGKRRSRNRGAWGTYFLRMIAFGERRINRLEQIIGALISWRTPVRTPFVMHLSSPETDGLRPRSGPCLQYIQFVRNPNHILDLTVLVRNHDYFQKAFGNFLGLGRLLRFVCDETGLSPGKLICHSVHAFSSSTKTTLRELVG